MNDVLPPKRSSIRVVLGAVAFGFAGLMACADSAPPAAPGPDAEVSVDAGERASTSEPSEPSTPDDAAAPAPNLPGGRPNFVAAIMGARYNGAWGRLATWRFHEDGSVEERFWRWDQTQAPSPADVLAQRAKSGHTTAGCPNDCDVWTAKGFEPGSEPTARTGAWTLEAGARVRLRWPDGHSELYELSDRKTYVELVLVEHDYTGVSTVYAAVFGSRAPLESGATADEIAAVGSLLFTTYEQNWDHVTVTKSVTIAFDQYHRCSLAPALVGKHPTVYHTYFAGDPATDGRKTYWYHQLASVAKQSTCANVQEGGHTAQLLQAIDDDGAFVGWVGVEASLLAKTYGGSIVSHIVMVLP